MRARVRGLKKTLKRATLALSGLSFTLLAPALATSTAGVGPWDTTLNLIQTDLSGPAAHALVGGDPRLIATHREAVTAALGELETYAQARRRRGQEWVTTGNLAAVRFDHLAARPSRTGTEKGYAPDPQLHTHVVIANLTRGPMVCGAVSNPSKFTARKAGRRHCTGPILPSVSDNWATA